MTPEELRGLAEERQATFRREAEVRRWIRRSGRGRPIRIVPPSPALARTIATAVALAGTLRVER